MWRDSRLSRSGKSRLTVSVSGNPYHPPSEDLPPHAQPPARILFLARFNLVVAAVGFGLLIYAKATRKSGILWAMSGELKIGTAKLHHYLATNRNWVEIEQYYRAIEGFLILLPAMFLVSGISLLARTRWSVALTHVTSGLATACGAAFLGVYFILIKESVVNLCDSLGTEVRDHVFVVFLAGLMTLMAYSLIQLRLLTRPTVKKYLEQI